MPSLAFRTLDGETVPIERYRGRVLVLNVWAPWCAPCVEEMPGLQRLAERLDPSRYAVVGLTVDDDRYLVDEFLRAHPVGFPILIDPGRRAIEQILRVRAFPVTLLVAPDGVLVQRITGGREWDTPSVIEGLAALSEPARRPLDRK